MSKTTNKMITAARLSLVGSLSLVSLTVLSGILLSSSVVSAEDIVDEINITVPSSCSLTGTNLNHAANMENGQYRDNIGSANISAFCNDPNGFAIYAVGFSEDTYGNNKMHDPNLDTTHDINTGKYVSGTTTNSTWSMKLTPVTGPYAPTIRNDSTYNYTNYEVVPSEYTKVAYSSAATETGNGATGSNFTTSYAIFVSQSQNAGSYTGKVKFTLVHPENETPAQLQPCEAGKICYHANTTSVQGQMGDQNATNSTETTLWAPNFKRNGYGFAGWNTAYDYSGTNYGPNQTITTLADIQTNGLSLYARWIPSQGTLQNWNGCSSMNIGDVTALTDNRDNDTYAVAKLADGKCWTIENLRLDNAPELTASNTHNPSLPLTNSWWYSSANDSDTKPTSNHLSTATDPTTTAWCTSNSAACDDQSMLATNNTTLFTNNTSTSYNASSNVYSYGNYYNWYSATAGHGKYERRSGYSAPGDICPAGWHLSTGDTSGEYNSLNTALSGTDTGTTASNNLRSYPNNFVYSGYMYDSSVYGRSLSVNYWSSSAYDRHSAYYLSLGSSYVGPGISNKYGGRVARCVAGV
ncbi:hypothetical protein IKF87_00945 [Candidatus Saccharibacteria bacterium]|nr:hypothetical protein [Candidatus Saccharibacteria bacterium]